MELLEGETLAARLHRGTVSVTDAVEYGAQIADALAAAHRRGVVHRDLKPANIMITPGGVKLLDFGLAGLRPDHEWLNRPDAEALTADGAIVGTVPYMAPEQLQGRTVDARADTFALGAVLYEMLAGRRAFERDNVAQSLAAVIDSEPPAIEEMRADVPPPLALAATEAKTRATRRRGAHANERGLDRGRRAGVSRDGRRTDARRRFRTDRDRARSTRLRRGIQVG
jgi:eukaryotic-like serine/threonine-protein kinase